MSDAKAPFAHLLRPFADVAALTEALARENVDLTDLVPDANGSIRTARAGGPMPALPTLAGGTDPEIVLRAPLSSGGMGQIHSATQTSVGREVAVKVAAKASVGTAARSDLVVEGRIAGRLEHPNIVPVHMLGLADDGSPLIVMQRIEGETWADVLARGKDLRRDVDALVHVCRALQFAHERGVLHRDVKPRNVMLGRFGEVYLLDWGVAVGFADAPAELPRATALAEIAGTPEYMAPEMVLPSAAPVIDARTDVYLVGAVIHELITGRAPHARSTIASSLLAAQASTEPTFSVDAPEELVAICVRAMKRDPRDRYASVDEVRRALLEFQRHEAARELCAGAEERLARIISGDGDVRAVLRAFTECRFAFTEALATWPESARARRGLASATGLMVRRELRAGHYDSAALLASELVEVPADLAAELTALKKKRDDEAGGVDAMVRFAREQDRRTAERERAFVVMAASACWLAMMVALALLANNDVFVAGAGTFAIVLGALATSFVAAGFVFPKLRSTIASRSMFVVMCASECGFAVAYALSWWFALSVPVTLALVHVCMSLFAAAYATRDAKIWRGVALSILVVPALALIPEHAYLVSGLGTFASVSAASAHLWWPTRHPPAPPSSGQTPHARATPPSRDAAVTS